MSITRTATCACGKLSIAIKGDPDRVLACACTQCQRRTGSAFNVSAYFNKSQIVAIEGPHKTFQRSSDLGRNIELHFCPDCGSTLFWYAEIFADVIGTAVGCFLDPAFPKPKAFGLLTRWIGCNFPPTFRFMRDHPSSSDHQRLPSTHG